ncbi:MAG: hypothetical protein PHO28_02480 [Candidatus Pacebacteria bacterium]|nr:hypothetical protein [Candidatus Paceibacterota bacterium]
MKKKKTKNINFLNIFSLLVLVTVVLPLFSLAQGLPECSHYFSVGLNGSQTLKPNNPNCILPPINTYLTSACCVGSQNQSCVLKSNGRTSQSCMGGQGLANLVVNASNQNITFSMSPDCKTIKVDNKEASAMSFAFDYLRKPDIYLRPCPPDPNDPELNTTITLEKVTGVSNQLKYSFHYCFKADVSNANYKGICSPPDSSAVAFAPIWPYKVYLTFSANNGKLFSAKGLVENQYDFYYENGRQYMTGTAEGILTIPTDQKKINIQKIQLKIMPNLTDPQYGYIFSSYSTGLSKEIKNVKLGKYILDEMKAEGVFDNNQPIDPNCKNPKTKKAADDFNKIRQSGVLPRNQVGGVAGFIASFLCERDP